MGDFIRAWDFIRARDFISDRRTENGGDTPSHHHFPSTRMPLSQIKARDFIRDFVRVRGLRKKHAHKAPEQKTTTGVRTYRVTVVVFRALCVGLHRDSKRA